jgi:pimeloyl-ACP methyl ester carboxylesterase
MSRSQRGPEGREEHGAGETARGRHARSRFARTHTTALSAALGAALLCTASLAAGCAKGSDVRTTVIRTTAIYSPTTGDIPIPNDLLFSGSTDGTLAIPLPTNPAEQGPTLALNGLDGWSTTAVMRVPFSLDVDLSTLVAGTTVRMFEVALQPIPGLLRGAPVQSVTRELATTEYTIGLAPESDATLTIAPTVPLEAETSYMVVITADVQGTDGFPVMRSIVYQLAAQTAVLPDSDPLRPLQRQILAMHTAADGAGVDPDDIVLSFAFTTQSQGGVISALRQIAQGDEATLIGAVCAANPDLVCTDTTPSPFSTSSLVFNTTALGDTATLIGSTGDADVYEGALALPYYLESAADVATPTMLNTDTTPRTTTFRARYPFGAGDTDLAVTGFNPLPEAREQQTVPVVLTVPKGPKPMGGWPIVVYQHAITADRSTLFGMADRLAISGFAAVAIDLPLHGLESGGTFDFLFAGHQDGQARERHFGLDLVDNTTGVSGADGLLDSSGAHFINLASLRTSRDNIYQAVADLFALTASLDGADYDGVVDDDFDTSQLYFIGHSLGAIVGSLYLQQSPAVLAAVLAMPGGGLARVLAESPSFGPEITAGLAAAGINVGTPEYEAFLFAAQTVLDDADPINYAAGLKQSDKPLLLFEVVGDAMALPVNLPDQTILNSIPGAPLSGTEPLITALDLTSISSNTMDATGLRGVVRFTDGDHTSLIVPFTSVAATFEMQNMAVEFFSSNGQMVSVVTPGVVQ